MTRVPGHLPSSLELETPSRDTSSSLDEPAASDWIGLGEASRILGISHGTLRRWADEGRLAVFTTPGGHRRFSRRLLQALLPVGRARRPSLARLGASPERIVRAYRPARLRRAAPAAPPAWLDALSDADQQQFRDGGRGIVAALLEHLDAAEPAAAAARLQEACQLAAEHGRQCAALGASLTEAVETFLRYRTPFVAALAGIARRRGLDTRETTDLLEHASAAMDRLLVATMTGHSLACGAASGGGPGAAPGAGQEAAAGPGAAALPEAAAR